MRRYDSYKDSGVAWIGEIPEHWDCVTLKRLAFLINEKTTDKLLPYIALEHIESFTGKLNIQNMIEPDSLSLIHI